MNTPKTPIGQKTLISPTVRWVTVGYLSEHKEKNELHPKVWKTLYLIFFRGQICNCVFLRI